MIANCPRCGRLFNKTVRDICEQCMVEETEIINTIRIYLKENKLATITDVVHDTEVDLEVILDLVDKGHIVLIDNPNIKFECSRCGLPTPDGRLCFRCREDLIHELASATQLVRGLKGSANDERTKFTYHSMKSKS